MIMLGASLFSAVALAGANGSSDAGLAVAGSSACNPVKTDSPSALYIQRPDPTGNLTSGGTISATYEYQVINFTTADQNMSLYFPTVYFTFTLENGGLFSMIFDPQTLHIAGAGWSNSANGTRSETATSNMTFLTAGKARLTTQRVAIMAPTGYGNLTLEFRWEWKVVEPNGTVQKSGWTKPTNQKNGLQLPSIFWPAPYVSFLGGTGPTMTIGTNYTATIGANVSGRYFFLEMENSIGTVVQSHGQTAANGATTFNVTIPVINYDSFMVPGKYLVHIHDSCGAILYNKSIVTVFAPSANISFALSIPSCGSITFNGTPFANGTTGTFAPSTAAYHFSIPKCKGHTFNSWATTGGLHIVTGSSMDVSASGTFTVKFN